MAHKDFGVAFSLSEEAIKSRLRRAKKSLGEIREDGCRDVEEEWWEDIPRNETGDFIAKEPAD